MAWQKSAWRLELSVVFTAVWANTELVEDGRAGFLVPKSTVPLEFVPEAPWDRGRNFAKKVPRQVDASMMEALAKSLASLSRTRRSAARWAGLDARKWRRAGSPHLH